MKKSDVIRFAKNHIGVREMGENEVMYNDYYYGTHVSGNEYPWCVVFLYYIFNECGVTFPKTAHCDGVRKFAKEGGQWVSKDQLRIGDCVVFDYDGDGSGDHIGLIVDIDGDNLTTIEGNYADSVAEVHRTKAFITGAYRPEYDDSAEDGKKPKEVVNTFFPELVYGMGLNAPKENVKMAQALMQLAGFDCGKIDGEFGSDTLKAVQNVHYMVDKSTVQVFRQKDWEYLIREVFKLL